MDSQERIEILETRFSAEIARLHRRVQVTWALAAMGCLGAFLLGGQRESIAQTFGVTLQQLATRVITLETKTQDITRITDPNTNQPTIRFTGVNVQIVNGVGVTLSANGTGNLIVGYNELRLLPPGPTIRTGSHCVILGRQNNYTSTSGIIGGQQNLISGEGACVLTGLRNTASDDFACVVSGAVNTANQGLTSILGGTWNIASGLYATIVGGNTNTASGPNSSVSGGYLNQASGANASVTGGEENAASGAYSTVSGGGGRSATGDYDWRGGGLFQDY